MPSSSSPVRSEPPPPSTGAPALPGKDGGIGIESAGVVLAVLGLINFFNYVDRQILGPLVPLLQRSVAQGGLGLSSTETGLLQSAFMVVHSLTSIPLGYAADRFLRKKVIAVGVGVWSVATAAAGFANGFGQLFAARASVGIGEATYAPAASAMISERFTPASRARALGIFQLGMVLGGAVAMVLGGFVGARWGWRAAFLVVGFPGLVLTGLVLLVRETPRGSASTAVVAASPGGSLAIDARRLLASPALVWICVAGILVTFFTGALLLWAPKFVLRYHYGDDVRYLKRVTTSFGAVALIAGVLGTLTGSWVADRIERRAPGAGRLTACAIGVFASVPFAAVGFLSHSLTVLFVTLPIGVFFNVWYVGPILAALHDVAPPSYRATATGAYLFLIHLLGDAISPAVVGRIADRTGSLRVGMLVATGVLALGGVAALAAIPSSRRVAKLKREASAR